MRNASGDTVAALLLMPFAILVYRWAWDFPQGKEESLGPCFSPKILAVVLGLLAALLAANSLFPKKKSVAPKISGDREGRQDETATRSNYLLIALVAFLLLVYVLVLPWLGFVAATSLFLTASIYALRRRYLLRIVFLSALFAGCVFVVFKMVLRVPLP